MIRKCKEKIHLQYKENFELIVIAETEICNQWKQEATQFSENIFISRMGKIYIVMFLIYLNKNFNTKQKNQ